MKPNPGRVGLDGRRGTGASRVLTLRTTPAHIATLDGIVSDVDGVSNRSQAIRWLIEDHARWARLDLDALTTP